MTFNLNGISYLFLASNETRTDERKLNAYIIDFAYRFLGYGLLFFYIIIVIKQYWEKTANYENLKIMC